LIGCRPPPGRYPVWRRVCSQAPRPFGDVSGTSSGGSNAFGRTTDGIVSLGVSGVCSAVNVQRGLSLSRGLVPQVLPRPGGYPGRCPSGHGLREPHHPVSSSGLESVCSFASPRIRTGVGVLRVADAGFSDEQRSEGGSHECPPSGTEPLAFASSGTATSGSFSTVTVGHHSTSVGGCPPPGMTMVSAMVGLFGGRSATGTVIIETDLLTKQRSAYRVQRCLRAPAGSQGQRSVSLACGEALVVIWFGTSIGTNRSRPR
jgi:hypothetical protein